MLRGLGQMLSPVLGVQEKLMPFKADPKHQAKLPQEVEGIEPSSTEVIDKNIKDLKASANKWIQMNMTKRVKLLRSCVNSVIESSLPCSKELSRVKGSYDQGFAEEWFNWYVILAVLVEYADFLESTGTLKPVNTLTRGDGQQVMDVFPYGLYSLVFGGIQSSVWIQKGKPATQGSHYRQKLQQNIDQGGKVGLILGAGNQISVVATDLLYKLVIDNEVAIVKMNPTNEMAGPYIEKAFKPLHEEGLFKIVYGGLEQGQYLTQHPGIESIHMTGSSQTYDAIVWGDNKAKVGDPKVKVPVAAELGNITPHIIVPGEWSEEDMCYHIQHNIAADFINNTGHNCLGLEVIVTARDWPQRERFLQILKETINKIQKRKIWYPGSDTKYEEFKEEFKQRGYVELGAEGKPGTVPWLLVTGLSEDEAQLKKENWCGVCQEVALDDCANPSEFLQKATNFANQKCWGSLTCSIYVPPSVEKQFPQQVDQAIADLKYGTIVKNGSGTVGYGTARGVWGAYPGNTSQDIGSGNCFVHNGLFIDYPEKQVVSCRWRISPTPVWSPFFTNLDNLLPALLKFTKNPSVLTLAPLALQGLRSKLV
eukprot:TRINITY_DN5083_c0_g1_i2.p1 TRINITY_DN5083_c0_g1~~TRINITY_DN5083_c0_g1_i2.p1  ORF type:complete len:593 (-),score=75.23 TRINITY_DN5083_c0_g1_i2:251-2029(-)